MKNVPTLVTLLVCLVAADGAHASLVGGGAAVAKYFQSRSKRNVEASNISSYSSSVEDWQLVCEHLCRAGYGGLGCGPQCDAQLSINRPSLLPTPLVNDLQPLCPELCELRLGGSQCTCPPTFADNLLILTPLNKGHLCTIACKLHRPLKGCARCVLVEPEATTIDPPTSVEFPSVDEDDTTTTTTTTVAPTTTATTTRTTPKTTTPNWAEVCQDLCRMGEGGSLCNCDMPPFF